MAKGVIAAKNQSSCARPFGFAQGKLAEGGCPHMNRSVREKDSV
jgi:hypothetical protein